MTAAPQAPWAAPERPRDPDADGGDAWGLPPRPPRDLVGALRATLVTTALMVLTGAPLGLVWGAVAPRLDLAAVSMGSETAFTTTLSADLTLAALALVTGLVAGIVAWSRRPVHPTAVVVGLAVGGLLATLVAARVGYLVELPALKAAVRPDLPAETLDLIAFRLRARGVLVVAPLVAVGVFAGLTARAPQE